jgi:hypothetical protein
MLWVHIISDRNWDSGDTWSVGISIVRCRKTLRFVLYLSKDSFLLDDDVSKLFYAVRDYGGTSCVDSHERSRKILSLLRLLLV